MSQYTYTNLHFACPAGDHAAEPEICESAPGAELQAQIPQMPLNLSFAEAKKLPFALKVSKLHRPPKVCTTKCVAEPNSPTLSVASYLTTSSDGQSSPSSTVALADW